MSNSGGFFCTSTINFSAMSSTILNWILIGCQCFIIGQLEKKCSKSDPNDIVPHIFIVIAEV